MKKIILSLAIFGLFQLGYSQKKELKTIDKQIKAGEYENEKAHYVIGKTYLEGDREEASG